MNKDSTLFPPPFHTWFGLRAEMLAERTRADAAEAQRDRLAVMLRAFGYVDSFDRWHLHSCAGRGGDPIKGDPWCRSDCIAARAALADVPDAEPEPCGQSITGVYRRFVVDRVENGFSVTAYGSSSSDPAREYVFETAESLAEFFKGVAGK